jgi:tetrahydromethanopterin S-methyltransferase subunit F
MIPFIAGFAFGFLAFVVIVVVLCLTDSDWSA